MLAILDEIRSKIDGQVKDYLAQTNSASFEPGKSFIPASGKVVDHADIQQIVHSALDGWFTSGRFCEDFLEKLAGSFGVKHALLTTSGSAANLLAFSALTSWKLKNHLRPGDEVITVAAGFPTTVAPIIQNQCIPVFVDVDLHTLNVNPEHLTDAVGAKTRAIMLAHTLGNPFNLDAVMQVARKNDLFVIEDCCDALGATYRGEPVGSFGDFGTVSFYPAHHITTGEGGAVVSNRKFLTRQAESFRDWGRDCWCPPGASDTCGKRYDRRFQSLPEGYDHKYVYSHIGYNMKMTDMQAALGSSQIEKVDRFIAKRRENFKFLDSALTSEGAGEHFLFATPTEHSNPSWFGFPLTIRDQSPLKRIDVLRYLEEHCIGTRLLFAGNILCQPGYRDISHRIHGTLKVTEKIMSDTFWIGVWPGIGSDERNYMVDTFVSMLRDLVK